MPQLKAARILNGTCEPKAIDWGKLALVPGAVEMVNEAIKEARGEVEMVLEMASAELGLK